MRLVHALVTLSVITAAAGLSGGCVENRATLYIESVLGQSGDSDECDITPPGEVFVASGSFDPGSGTSYVAYLVVANQMVPLGDNDTLRPETSRIQLEGAEISMPGQDTYSVPFSATVHPDPSTAPGYVTVGVPILRSDVTAGVYQVTVVVYGTTLGGLNVESGEFVFPITVFEEGTFAFCGSLADMTDEGYPTDPCGRFGQDGYLYPCSDVNFPGCDVCP